MKIPPELERQILAMPGVVVNVAGAIESKTDAPTPAAAKMVAPSVAFVGDTLVAYIPCVTRSEANESSWVRKMQRKLPAKRITRETLGPYAGLLVPFAEAWHRGEAYTEIRVVRAPEHDAWAAVDATGVCWAEGNLPKGSVTQ